ncbi:hypothetical protein [Deinococcus koreensis]|uniref:Uncharacterized protein n=1 Tax=Deinococcus koreensis TaxID=2054903 RepID=A0A2K3V0F3_9DEIO|nr:hypothetical protein [Deinococcus koreensis]PNY82255.1 hypothetical protein CVO96_13600 [Deinococcus koreensis]
MRVVAWLAVIGLGLLALVLGLLTLGAFASLSAGAPLALRSVGTLSATLGQSLGLEGLSPLSRALALTLLTSVVAALAAYIKPRS